MLYTVEKTPVTTPRDEAVTFFWANAYDQYITDRQGWAEYLADCEAEAKKRGWTLRAETRNGETSLRLYEGHLIIGACPLNENTATWIRVAYAKMAANALES